MDTLWQDVKYGARMLLKRPGFTAVAILTLALGIGANTAIFTLVSAVFLNPLPVKDISTLVNVNVTDSASRLGSFTLLPVSLPNYEDFRDQSDVFTGLVNYIQTGVTLSGEGDPQPLPGMLVTANYFDVLGVRAVHGRTFFPDEDKTLGGNPLAVVSYSLWQDRFRGDPGLLGRSITLNGHAYTVIGIAPPRFKGLGVLAPPNRIWIPISMREQVLSGFFLENITSRRALFTEVFGRLKPGVTLEQAEAALQTIAARLEQEYPADNKGRSVRLIPVAQAAIGGGALQGANQRGQFVTAGGVLMTVVGLVLLIACVNLANLLLARAAVREKEMGIRAALGAGRARLLRQLLTESVLLALIGGAAGLLLAYWGRDLLWSFRPPFLNEQAISLALDARVLWFTLGLSVLTGAIFGLVPALRASRPDLNRTLKTGGRSGSPGRGARRLRAALVVAEIALALVALVGAGLFVRSLQHAQRIDLGFESEKLFLVGFNVGARNLPPEQGLQFYRAAVERARGTPGVEAAAVAGNGPIGGGLLRSVFPEGQVQEAGRGVLTTTNPVSPGYFDTMRIPLLRGRNFTEFDRADSPQVAIVNEAMGRQFWPGQDALGQRFSFIGETVLVEIVGVVRDTVVVQLGEEPRPVVYLPLPQQFPPFAMLHVRTAGAPEELLPVVRQRVQELDRDMALLNPTTIRGVLDNVLWAPRMGAGLLGLFGALALALAAVGIYGVMAESVNQRTQEIGIRMALGARPADVLKLVFSHALLLTGLGTAAGLALAFAGGSLVESLLFGINARDPVTLAGVPVLLALVAVAACWVPARRAMRTDPVTALRYE